MCGLALIILKLKHFFSRTEQLQDISPVSISKLKFGANLHRPIKESVQIVEPTSVEVTFFLFSPFLLNMELMKKNLLKILARNYVLVLKVPFCNNSDQCLSRNDFFRSNQQLPLSFTLSKNAESKRL
jgi:hypothetical protein